jgi:hypothetical protein
MPATVGIDTGHKTPYVNRHYTMLSSLSQESNLFIAANRKDDIHRKYFHFGNVHDTLQKSEGVFTNY